jgi:hypothetical protein
VSVGVAGGSLPEGHERAAGEATASKSLAVSGNTILSHCPILDLDMRARVAHHGVDQILMLANAAGKAENRKIGNLKS